MTMDRWTIAIILAGALSLGSLLIGCATNSQKTSIGQQTSVGTNSGASGKIGTAVGDTAPDFQLTKMDGTPVSLAELKGQPTVLVFWTAWCPICKGEAPQINQLATAYEPKGVRVLGINIQDSLARTEGGIREFGIRYAVARDEDASVTRRYNVMGTPTILFLDRRTVVRYLGHELPSDYSARLDALLNDKG